MPGWMWVGSESHSSEGEGFPLSLLTRLGTLYSYWMQWWESLFLLAKGGVLQWQLHNPEYTHGNGDKTLSLCPWEVPMFCKVQVRPLPD